MKKGIILGSLMGVVLFSTTGCGAGGKQLNCTIEDESESAKVSQQTLVSFDSKENLSHVKITTITDANSDYADEMDDYEESVKQSVEENDEEHIKLSYKRNGNKLTLVMDYYVSDMTDAEKEEYGFDDPEENTYDNIKSTFEDQGYTCK